MSRGVVAPPAEVKLKGKVMLVKVDFNALAAIEEKTGRSVMELGMWKTMSLKDLRTMIWAAMLFGDPDLTEEAVGKMVHPGNLARVMSIIVETWKRSVPKQAVPFATASQ